MLKSRKIILALVVLLVIVGGIYIAAKSRQSTPGGPIKIGAILSMTGPAASFGESNQKGIALAVDEINSKGGINGRKIEVITEDDHTSAKDAVSAWNKLVSVDGVQGIIGGLWDFNMQSIIPLALSSKVVLISPTNLRIAGSLDMNDQSFVMLSDFNKAILDLKPAIESRKLKRIAVVRYASGFGREITKTLKQIMDETGGQIVADEEYGQLGGNDFRTTILKLQTKHPDGVFIDMIGPDILNFLRRSNELDFHPVVMSHVDIVDSLENPNVDKKLLNGVVVLNWQVVSPGFANLFEAKYGIAPERSADKSYDAVYVLTNAISRTNNKSEVAGYIASHVFKTINGEIKFTPEHSSENSPVAIQIIKNGELVPF